MRDYVFETVVQEFAVLHASKLRFCNVCKVLYIAVAPSAFQSFSCCTFKYCLFELAELQSFVLCRTLQLSLLIMKST